MHNVHYLLSLMASARDAVIADRYPDFLRQFFRKRYHQPEQFPDWAVRALQGVGVNLLAD